ncbi:PQQ-dependent sugar dehydrogenase [Aquabacterium sp. OR-4]|uniref:PQQ-dependent sugar dehydrogenase n=1 Tax=Aquabacterium sp. OR-4 TaxID=2978127 RepID=UPI0021B45687|nr:PQQ-dependent sugar dehydrogenase [Aquabacterium sp. OR-4]MDT7837143.1 PQQ-dependent sugar dehydrogenase [Aquabacterium sp. OR-4]
MPHPAGLPGLIHLAPGPGLARARRLLRRARHGAGLLLANGLLAAGLLGGASPAALAQAPASSLKAQPVAHGLVNPWGLAFLPDGRMLVTERPGRMRIVAADGKLGPPLPGLPTVVAEGQGGLLDVVLDPRFASNRLVYWSYSEGADDGGNSTAVARARLDGAPGAERLAEVQVIFRQMPRVASRLHFGSRLAFGQDGRLFITLGDRFTRKDDAQTLDNTLGKVVRIESDGRIPADNPYAAANGTPRPGVPANARPEIWSLGHRNVQGAAVHPVTGELWTTEHGPQGGDELNLTQAGRNHGWPVITYGRNYGTGTKIGDGTERNDVVAPVSHWLPVSIAPSGMAFLTSDRYPGWKGNLFIGALRGQALLRLELDGHKLLREERLLRTLNERIRDVRQGPDGWLYVLTDNPDGRILRLVP